MHKKTALFIGLLSVVVIVLWSQRSRPSGEVNVTPSLASPEIVDLKDGDQYDLTAGYIKKTIGGKTVDMLAYNGTIPGPIIRVHEGDRITVNFYNKTGMKTLLHSHGVRMDNSSDGSQLTQKEMEPGESFSYELRFPDPGVYWYHPHVREDKEQNMGLFGNYIVIPKDPAYWPPADREETLMLSDVLIEDGNIAPYADTFVTHALMGRFGNTLLVNGQTNFVLKGKPGEVHRLYVTNAATTRVFNFRVKGAQMKLVGGDGGRYEKETMVESVLLGPSERAVVDVLFPSSGSYVLQHVTPDNIYTLGSAEITGEKVDTAGRYFSSLRADKEEGKQFSLLRKELARDPDKKIRLLLDVDMQKIMSFMGSGEMTGGMHDHGTMGGMNMPASMMGGHMHQAEPIEWEDNMGAMNVFSTNKTVRWIIEDEATKKQNMDIVWKLKQGGLVKVRITNDIGSMHPMHHPIHFHGNRFVVLSRDGVVNDNMVWKDTALVKTGEVVDILLETTNPGKWMGHCHIAEHMHSGMMMEYDVE